MIRALVLAAMVLAMAGAARAEVACLLIEDARDGTLVHAEGDDCAEGIGPASSFKFALSVMGFDAGILVDADTPAWPYDERYAAARAVERQTTTPRRWMAESVLWYSRVLVAELGAERLAAYLKQFRYGNADITGDPGAGNGLTHAWLNSSLQITPQEQLAFIRRFVLAELGVSAEATRLAAETMPAFAAGPWVLRGKTGTGYIKEADGQRGDRQFGWFVGWASLGDRVLVYSYLQKDSQPGGSALGPATRDDLLARWTMLVD